MTADEAPDAQNGYAAGARIKSADRRWLALVVLCLGDLMIVLDVTIVGVALPSIRADLGFSEESLAWPASHSSPLRRRCAAPRARRACSWRPERCKASAVRLFRRLPSR